MEKINRTRMQLSIYLIVVLAALPIVVGYVGCGKKSEPSDTESGSGALTIDSNEEHAQQIGDVMASIDEAGGVTGSVARNSAGRPGQQRIAASERMSSEIVAETRAYARLFGKRNRKSAGSTTLAETASAKEIHRRGYTDTNGFFELLLPQAEAVSCIGYGFGSCVGNTVTRNFNGCTVAGLYTLSGTVSFSWTGASASCVLGGDGDAIKRSPNFSISGPRGGTLTISKTGTNGQVLTWSSGSGATRAFDFTNDGVSRKITYRGTTYYDVTTQTTSPIIVSGTNRSNRIVSGGTLRLSDALSGSVCDVSPSNVTWESTCTCATSGTWSGSCGGQTFLVALTGCGSGTVTVGTSTQSVTFDRCSEM